MTARDRSPLTPTLAALNVIAFLSFCNVAIFFQFHDYLETLSIDPRWFGFLMAVFSLLVMVARPFISPFIHPANARKWLLISTGSVIAALLLYGPARTLETLTLVRLAHGAAYAVMNTALVALLVSHIPAGKSGRAFSLFSIVTLLPYAVIPPIIEPVTPWAGGFVSMLNLSVIPMAFIFPIIFLLKPAAAEKAGPAPSRSWPQGIQGNFHDPAIPVILVIAMVVWGTFASVFYFIESYGAHLGIQNAGWFLTSSTVAEIGIRIAGQKVLDRYDKPIVLGAGVACLGAGFLFLATVSTRPTLLLVGFWLGLGWGVVVPLLTAIVFDRSQPRFRALNTNLIMSVFQGGFFLGPLLANAVILRWDQGVLYKVSGLILLLAVLPALMIRGKAEKCGD